MPETLLPTTVVGSYPQPDWLVDRELLQRTRCRGCASRQIWRVPEPFLEQAQDDATLARDSRHGARRHRRHHRRRDAARELFEPVRHRARGDRQRQSRRDVDRSGARPRCRASSARSAARRRSRCATWSSCAATPTARPRSPCPAPSPWRSRRRTILQGRRGMAMDYAAAVNEEVHELAAAGADVIQLDEPWLRNDPDAAKRYRHQGDQPGAGRHRSRRSCIFASAMPRW